MENVGISLGSNSLDRIVSVNVLKIVELDPFKVIPKSKVNDHMADSDLDEDEADAKYDGQLLSHLVGDASEVGLDEIRLESFIDLTATVVSLNPRRN